MATVVDYDYIQEISTQEALHNMTSDVTTGYDTEIPGVNTFKINASTSTYNFPEGEGGSGIAGWSTNVNWIASDYNTVARGSGSVYLPDGTSLAISSGNTGNMSITTYIYYDRDLGSVQTTTSAQDSVGENKILLCVASPTSVGKDAAFQAFGTNKQSTFITADNIAANTITGNEIYANSIDTAQLASGAVTAGKIDVSQLSAISANLGTITAGDITGTTITAGDTSGTAIVLNPNNNRIQIYYNGSIVGYIYGTYVSGAGSAVSINGNYVAIPGTAFMSGKLRIPVGTDLYE